MFAFTRTGSIAAARKPPAEVESSTDEKLIGRIASADQLAMRTLFVRHQLRVYRFVLRIVKDETLAEDLLSDVFLDVWRQAARFEGRTAVSTWLLAIARFKALSAMRRGMDVGLDDDMAATIVDPADAEAVLRHKHDADMLRRYWTKLSPAHAEVIDLVYYHGKSIKEVAEIVGVPIATVKSRMFYARKQLAVSSLQDTVARTIH
jgi:RNA polymerase sigma-70 factor (ECF subfamily)